MILREKGKKIFIYTLTLKEKYFSPRLLLTIKQNNYLFLWKQEKKRRKKGLEFWILTMFEDPTRSTTVSNFFLLRYKNFKTFFFPPFFSSSPWFFSLSLSLLSPLTKGLVFRTCFCFHLADKEIRWNITRFRTRRSI